MRIAKHLAARRLIRALPSEPKTERNAAAFAENSGDTPKHCPRESTSKDALGYENDSV
jgi:hypothetical protein